MGKRQNVSAKGTVTTREFIEDYVGLECDLKGWISHERMEEFVVSQGKPRPRRVNIDFVSREDILRGNFILVRSEGGRKRRTATLLPYRNPNRQGGPGIMVEQPVVLQKK